MIDLHYGQSVTLTLPIPQETMIKVTLSLQKLQEVLRYFGTVLQDKWAIFKRVELTKLYLQQLSTAIASYNNIIAGSGNTILGDKNFVIGNYDTIEGSNNWVLVSQYTGQINGDLLIGQWRVELDKSYLIQINTKFAISFLNDDINFEFRNRFASKNRKFCNWDKWTRPQYTKTDGHWKKYAGYSQWKTNILQQKPGTQTNNLLGSTSTLGWGW